VATPAPSRPAVPTNVPHLCAAFKTSCRAISSAQTTAPPSSTAAPTASTRRQPPHHFDHFPGAGQLGFQAASGQRLPAHLPPQGRQVARQPKETLPRWS